VAIYFKFLTAAQTKDENTESMNVYKCFSLPGELKKSNAPTSNFINSPRLIIMKSKEEPALSLLLFLSRTKDLVKTFLVQNKKRKTPE